MLNFIIFSNIWIALGAMMMCVQSYFIFDQKINLSVCFFVFFSTFFSYNFQRLVQRKDYATSSSERHLWILNHTTILNYFLVMSGIISVVLFCFILSFLNFFVIGFVGVISFLYAVAKLRNRTLLKIFLISISWAFVCSILPLISNVSYLELIKLTVCYFLFIFAITIPFDIRDMPYDANSSTIPQLIGESHSKTLSIVLLWVSLGVLQTIIPSYYLIPLYVFISAIIYYSSVDKQEYYFSGLIDGVIILQALIIALFEK